MELGARIAAWRKASGLTQRQLADAVDLSVAAVCMWEKGHNQPSQKSLDAVVKAFGISYEQFYGRIPKGKKAAA